MKIMFVCTGNICRSAMAHKLLEKKLKEMNRNDIEVFSCGIYAQTGDIPTWEVKTLMQEKYDISMEDHRATHIAKSPIKEMDIILCATKSHKMDILCFYPMLKEKLFTMKEYVSYHRKYHDDIDIQDPWGYDMETYQNCIGEIEECIDLLIKKIVNEQI